MLAMLLLLLKVLATGLSALYSDLPTSVEIVVDEWQSPLPVIETSVPQLRRFIQSLEFCNSVLQVSPLKRGTESLCSVFVTHTRRWPLRLYVAVF